jgi:peptidoglycan/LPS O-acetylase OafA/YrhL
MIRSFILSYPRAALRELWQRPRGQIPALDAMRTFAVLFVIAHNFTNSYLEQGGTENVFSRLPFVRGGWIGVDLFFVLSGYLIGKQLWRELLQTQTINVSRFILRRGLRIWPLYFFFLFFVVAFLGRGSFPFGRWWTDAVFLTNYVNQGVVMGSWSLCTEEQFYVFAPMLLLLGAQRSGPIARYRRYLWALLVLLPMARAATWWWFTGGLASHDPQLFIRVLYEPIHTHSDGLVMGLLLANFEATAR